MNITKRVCKSCAFQVLEVQGKRKLTIRDTPAHTEREVMRFSTPRGVVDRKNNSGGHPCKHTDRASPVPFQVLEVHVKRKLAIMGTPVQVMRLPNP